MTIWALFEDEGETTKRLIDVDKQKHKVLNRIDVYITRKICAGCRNGDIIVFGNKKYILKMLDGIHGEFPRQLDLNRRTLTIGKQRKKRDLVIMKDEGVSIGCKPECEISCDFNKNGKCRTRDRCSYCSNINTEACMHCGVGDECGYDMDEEKMYGGE